MTDAEERLQEEIRNLKDYIPKREELCTEWKRMYYDMKEMYYEIKDAHKRLLEVETDEKEA